MLQWESPLCLRDDRTRRLYSQELVSELLRVGAATRSEMRDANVSLLKVPAEGGELAQVLEVARRIGWVELRDRSVEEGVAEKEWALTDAGRATPPPESLRLSQVVARVLRFADPVRKRAADWLPLAALVAGAAAAARAEASHGDTTLLVIRLLSIAVLLAALARGGVGEVKLFRAAKAFSRLQKGGYYEPIKAFFSWERLVWVAAFDVAVLACFGLAIFLTWWALFPAAVASLVYAVIEFRWRTPARAVARRRPQEATPGSRRDAVPSDATG